MKKYTSDKIANLSWICSILIVLIHATTYAVNLPGQATASVYGKNLSTFVQMFLAEGVCRIAVPLFFVFSGYLFFRNFELTPAGIWKKYKKRIATLLIPYLFWSIGTFLFFYIAQSIPATAAYFSSRSVVGIGFPKTLQYIFLNSLNSPLWYLSNLIILTLLTPVIYVLIKRVWWLALPLAAFCGIFEIGFLTLRGSSVCWFCFGSFFAIQQGMLKKWCEKAVRFRKPVTWGLLAMWLLILIGKSIYLCSLPVAVLLYGQYDLILKILSVLNVAIGLSAVWLSYDCLGERITGKPFRLRTYGMMLFVMHHPIISIIKKSLWSIFGGGIYASLIYFVLSAVLTVGIVIVISMVLKKSVPRVYSFISGGR